MRDDEEFGYELPRVLGGYLFKVKSLLATKIFGDHAPRMT